MHPHPITPQHQRIYAENRLIGGLNGAMDVKDVPAMRRFLEQYRREYPEDDAELQDGYAVIADCFEHPGAQSRAAAERWLHDAQRLDAEAVRQPPLPGTAAVAGPPALTDSCGRQASSASCRDERGERRSRTPQLGARVDLVKVPSARRRPRGPRSNQSSTPFRVVLDGVLARVRCRGRRCFPRGPNSPGGGLRGLQPILEGCGSTSSTAR